jgi:hypothetical protein
LRILEAVRILGLTKKTSVSSFYFWIVWRIGRE